MMEHAIRTIAGMELQTCQLLGIPYQVRKYSTLNEKLGFKPDILISDTDMPTLKYLAFGNGGHRTTEGKNGIPLIERIPHMSEDLALFNFLPCVLRLPQEDLSPEERVNYRGRTLEEHNGKVYVAYYLKVLDLSETKPKLELREVRNGVTTSVDYEYSIKNLNPVKPNLRPNQHLVTSGDLISVTAKVPYSLSKKDVDEFKNAANIIYGSEAYAIISEVALCTGVDKGVTGEFNGTTMGYTEAIAAQIYSIISTSNILTANNNGVDAYFDVGSIEPLLKIEER